MREPLSREQRYLEAELARLHVGDVSSVCGGPSASSKADDGVQGSVAHSDVGVETEAAGTAEDTEDTVVASTRTVGTAEHAGYRDGGGAGSASARSLPSPSCAATVSTPRAVTPVPPPVTATPPADEDDEGGEPTRIASVETEIPPALMEWFSQLGLRESHLESIARIVHKCGATEPSDLADMLDDDEEGLDAFKEITGAIPVAKRKKFKTAINQLRGDNTASLA